MSADALVIGLFVVVLAQGYALHIVHRGLVRRDEWLAQLTRRVWKLEGSPPCDCGAEDCR